MIFKNRSTKCCKKIQIDLKNFHRGLSGFFSFQLREVATAPHLGDFSSEEKALYDFLFSSEYRRRAGMSLACTNWTRLISFCSVPSVIDIKPYRDYSVCIVRYAGFLSLHLWIIKSVSVLH